MLLLFAQFLALAAVIVTAGSFLARYGDAIGEQTGLGGSLAGLILLASATSLPELTVDCSAAMIGAPNLAVGDLFGSSLFNLLILAGLDLYYRPRGEMFSRISAAHALSATMSVILTAIALMAMLLAPDWTIAGIGPGPVAILLTYVLALRLVFYDQRFAITELGQKRGVETAVFVPLQRAIIGFVMATFVILAAAPSLAATADELAEQSGLGGTFLGTTLVALSTSLPELVTTLTAIRIGARDLAVGNIFGSNSFNMAILAVVDGFYRGSLLSSVSPTHAVTAVSVILVTSVATMSLLYRPKKRWWLIEPDALLIVALIVGALLLIYKLRAA
jgi:cation:H+ antiporter